ncbi:hypothetical protein PHYC_03414 [Phycisphaerales bacterium]|nr:hypothetical protein PHYC_03414 [Phycisphaerales bacterium]
MNAKLILAAGLTVALLGCANRGQGPEAKDNNSPEPGEVKVQLAETPAAVRTTIERELAGGELEDIAKEERDGRTVYETDIVRDGREWEVVVAEDGKVISKKQESAAGKDEASRDGWQDRFDVNKSSLTPIGNNPWLTMQPGRVLKLTNGKDTLTISVLNETRVVDGVTVGILEERETKNGKLAEISYNFFATDTATGDVYYFGEDVDNYKDGKVINHDSAWRSGVDGARFGLMIPGNPRAGQKYYQEIAPGVALDRVEIVSTDATLKTPAGTFEHCLHLKETTPLEAGVSHKWYAPGVGMIKDDEFELAEKP